MSQKSPYRQSPTQLAFNPSAALGKDSGVVIGDLVGNVGVEVAATDARRVAHIAHETYVRPDQVVAAEAWAVGDRIFWHETGAVYTRHRTHRPVGWAAKAKIANQTIPNTTVAAGSYIAVFNPVADDDKVIAPFDFAALPAAIGANGVKVLRTFGGTAEIEGARIYTAGDSSLAPGTATISVGDGTGSNDQIVAAAALSTYSGTRSTDITPAASTALTGVSITIAGGPVTAGWLAIEVDFRILG